MAWRSPRTCSLLALVLCRQRADFPSAVRVAQVCFVLQEADLVLLARVSGGRRSSASIALDAAAALLCVVRFMAASALPVLACNPKLSGCAWKSCYWHAGSAVCSKCLLGCAHADFRLQVYMQALPVLLLLSKDRSPIEGYVGIMRQDFESRACGRHGQR